MFIDQRVYKNLVPSLCVFDKARSWSALPAGYDDADSSTRVGRQIKQTLVKHLDLPTHQASVAPSCSYNQQFTHNQVC